MLRLGTIAESSRRLDAGRHRAFVVSGDSGEAGAGVLLITTGVIPSRPVLGIEHNDSYQKTRWEHGHSGRVVSEP